MKPLAQNTLIQNRYLIVHLIGKGGMGEVYLAVDQRLGSAVALKRTYYSEDEGLGTAFEREARTLARLRHPVLPKVSDHFSENGDQFLVMEHISGDDLSKRMEAAQKAFPLSWVMFWADQLLDALSYLHSHEPPIIHRDIKPQNLKLTDENHIILLDFGLSKDTAPVPGTSGKSGSVVGYTPHFAPMEQIRGIGTDARSDLYSLSATLYQLMTNTMPEDSLTRADTMLSGMTDPIKPLPSLNPEVPKAISDVILKGMDVSREKRFESARAMQKALRKAYANMSSPSEEDVSALKTMIYTPESAAPAGAVISGASSPEPSSSSMDKTEVMDAGQMMQDYGQAAVQNSAGSQPPADFDPNATVAFDQPNVSDVKQSDLKTEVFIAGSNPLPYSASDTAEDASPAFSGTVDTSPPSEVNTSFGEDSYGDFGDKADEGFAPDATMPIVAFNEGSSASGGVEPATPEFFTTPAFADQAVADAESSEAESGGSEQAAMSATAGAGSAATTAASPKKKSSAGKIIAIFGGLFLLFVVGLAAVGGGWYYYTNYYAAAVDPEPTPTPTPEETPEPTPEPTIESELETNSNTETGDGTNTETNANTEDVTPEPTRTGTPGSATPRPTPRTTPVRTPRATPIAPATPRPTPQPTRRTLLQ
jgi:serine/threonine protein kinase